MFKFLFFVATLFVFSTAVAQRQNVYFLKNNGKYVNSRDSADYITVVREPDSASTLYNIFEFYKDGKKKLVGKSSRIDPPKFEGQCISYYNNGNKESLVNYKDGVLKGAEYDFFPNGKPYRVKEYADNADQYKDIDYNFVITDNYDSLGTALVKDGNGYYKGYDSRFKYVEEEGTLRNGKKEGIWKGCFKDFYINFTESYADGRLVSGTAVDTAGKSITYSKSRQMPPEFKGGVTAFGQYLGSHIKYPYDARRRGIQGTVILSFIVEKDGKINDIKVNKSADSELDAEAVSVLKKSPLWVPGTLCGKPMRVNYSVPITFNLSN